MSVAITGRPLAAASMADRGKPSRYDGSTKRSKARIDVLHVVPLTSEDDAPAATGSGELLGRDGIGLVGIGASDHHEDDVGVRVRRRSAASKSSRKPFCQTRRATVPTTTASTSTPRSARAWRRRCSLCFGTEALQVDAVAEQHQLVGSVRRGGSAPRMSSGFWTSSAPEHSEAARSRA